MSEPWVELATARTASGDLLCLRRSGERFEIRCNGWELMANRAHHSEEEMARLACRPLMSRGCVGAPAVLVGGLGMGFTLRAALEALPAAARLTVAEALPDVVAWNRGPLAALAGRPLADHRVAVAEGDVALLLAASPGAFDAILLDVDNGPGALSLAGNGQLYDAAGIACLRRALRPNGVLAVWSADPAPAFEVLLTAAGFAWQAHPLPARGHPGDPEHTVYVAEA